MSEKNKSEGRPDYRVRMGCPPKYKPEYCQQVIDFMGKGYSLTAFAGHIKVARETIYDWERRYPDFSDAIKKARAARLSALEEVLLKATNSHTVTARIFALKNAAPSEWRDRHDVEHSGDLNFQIVNYGEEEAISVTNGNGNGKKNGEKRF